MEMNVNAGVFRYGFQRIETILTGDSNNANEITE